MFRSSMFKVKQYMCVQFLKFKSRYDKLISHVTTRWETFKALNVHLNSRGCNSFLPAGAASIIKYFIPIFCSRDVIFNWMEWTRLDHELSNYGICVSTFIQRFNCHNTFQHLFNVHRSGGKFISLSDSIYTGCLLNTWNNKLNAKSKSDRLRYQAVCVIRLSK